MRFTTKMGSRGQVTIPLAIKEAYDINRTDIIELDIIKVVKK